MASNACCKQYAYEARARAPREGKFIESHVCPKCGTALRIIFQGIRMIGDEFVCEAVGIE